MKDSYLGNVGCLPCVWRFGEVASCLDTALRLAKSNLLPAWGSVQVVRQTAGRGQLRRRWQSPSGNLYVALRLPVESPFDGQEAAPALGVMLAEALRAEGWPVCVKWPNDIVAFPKENAPAKIGGILLEAQGDILLAGIGINVVWAPHPEQMRHEASLEATCLACLNLSEGLSVPPTAEQLWQCLVTRLYSAYDSLDDCHGDWRGKADNLLLWRGRYVDLKDGNSLIRGRLIGLGQGGGVLLEYGSTREEFFHGSLCPSVQ